MDDDRISRLPEHVKHHILSFLQEIREVVRTSSLSKSWLQTWRTFQISDFQFWSIVPSTVGFDVMLRNGYGETETESFVRFVDGALTRSRNGMPRFRLYASLRVASHVDRWLGMALDNHVEELTLNIVHFTYLPINPGGDTLPYSVPERVFSAEFIKSLTLSGHLKIVGIGSVSLPSLRSLILDRVGINDQMFVGLLGGCRLLEDLSVRGCDWMMPEIQVSNLNYLKSVTVSGQRLKLVSIRAPALESFSLDSVSTRANPQRRNGFSLSIPESPNLRSLNIRADCVNDVWFCQFLYEFRMLESLTVSECYSWKRIWMLNPLLKKVVIKSCPDLVDIRVDTPELSSFYYQGCGTTRCTKLPFLWSESPPNSCAAGFTISLFQGLHARWFEELQKFLTGWSTTFRCLEQTLHLCEWENETREVRNKKSETLSAPGTQHLKLIFKLSEMDYSIILDSFLSTCRPTTILLMGTYPFRKFVCEMLGNREATPLPDVRCWRHELKDVKIARIQSTQHHRGPLDWSTLFSLLPTLSESDEICFPLQWEARDSIMVEEP